MAHLQMNNQQYEWFPKSRMNTIFWNVLFSMATCDISSKGRGQNTKKFAIKHMSIEQNWSTTAAKYTIHSWSHPFQPKSLQKFYWKLVTLLNMNCGFCWSKALEWGIRKRKTENPMSFLCCCFLLLLIWLIFLWFSM